MTAPIRCYYPPAANTANVIFTCSAMFRNGLFGSLPAWRHEIVPGDWVIHLLNAHHGPIGFIPEVMADYRVHSRAVDEQSRAEQYADILRMMSRVDHHFGQYARQIDQYRIDLVTRLANWLDAASNEPPNWRRLRRVREQRRASPAAVKAVLSMGRKVEGFSRRVRTAVGLRKKAG